jgi:hypothetical protein
MEENVTSELRISEEQLQTITGGCGVCDSLNQEIVYHTDKANQHDLISRISTSLNDHLDADMHSQLSNFHSQLSQMYVNTKNNLKLHSTPSDPPTKRQGTR